MGGNAIFWKCNQSTFKRFGINLCASGFEKEETNNTIRTNENLPQSKVCDFSWKNVYGKFDHNLMDTLIIKIVKTLFFANF